MRLVMKVPYVVKRKKSKHYYFKFNRSPSVTLAQL
jgi:hypothetical protein